MALLILCIDLLIERLPNKATDELNRLFCDRYRHAITYNHYFTETAQKISDARDNKRLLEVLEKMFPLDYNRTTRTGPKDLSVICSIRYAATGTNWPVHRDFRLILTNQKAAFKCQKYQFSLLTMKYIKTTPILT